MIKVVSALFCDSIHELSDGRHILGPVLPGVVNFDTTNGRTLTTSLFLCLSCGSAGAHEADIRTVGPDGAVVHLDRLSFSVPDARAQVQVAMRNVAVQVGEGGILEVGIREPGDDWKTAATLTVDVPRRGPDAPMARFGYGTSVPFGSYP